ncbi:hypothetical protein ABW21_db0207619 [Orbilia brochopaga]|nr:hypothetical protein ABW21_db0207619 [Drechslerella brochopaga]
MQKADRPGSQHDAKHQIRKRANVHKRSHDPDGRQVTRDLDMYEKPPGIPDLHDWIDNPHITRDQSEGAGVDIFVIDTGLAKNADKSKEFKHAYDNRQFKGWIIARSPFSTEAPFDRRAFTTGAFHGTYVLSKIIGNSTGWARKANIWVVVVPDNSGYEKDPGYRAIINLSGTTPTHRTGAELDPYLDLTATEKRFVEAISQLQDIVLKMLIKRQNVVLVTGTGNGLLGSPVKTYQWPAKRGNWGKNLVVVGSADVLGNINSWDRADFVKVYGIVEDVVVPEFKNDPGPPISQLPTPGEPLVKVFGVSYGKPSSS